MAAADEGGVGSVEGEIAALKELIHRQDAQVEELRGLMTKVLNRLLDAVVPTAEMIEARRESEQPIDYTAELQPQPTMDWTDPFIGLTVDRPTNMVGRVEAGGALPFTDPQAANQAVDAWRERGDGAFEEWAADTYVPDLEGDEIGAWIDPLDI